jgi:hypothetical protein
MAVLSPNTTLLMFEESEDIGSTGRLPALVGTAFVTTSSWSFLSKSFSPRLALTATFSNRRGGLELFELPPPHATRLSKINPHKLSGSTSEVLKLYDRYIIVCTLHIRLI